MMQTSRTSDVLRCIVLNAPRGPNLACPRDGLSGAKPAGVVTLGRETLVQRRSRVTLAQWEGNHLAGLASARTRAGHRVWEVDRLFLPKDKPWSHNGYRWRPETWDAFSLELLRALIEEVGRRHAERIFLRLPSGVPLVSLARRAGFFPRFEETLLEGSGKGSPAGAAGTPNSLQEPLPEDDYALFQLFSAATPHSVRAAVGLTFDQWQDAHEPHSRGWTERIVKEKGRVTGWLGVSQRRKVTGAQVLAHPNCPDLWAVLVERALAREGFQRWLVPDYQEAVTALLLGRGYRELARYTILVLTAAAPVVNHGMAPVEARGW